VVNSIPPFPRHLSPAERAIERKRIVAAMVAEIVADNPGSNMNRDKMAVAFLDLVNTSWTADRIAELERRLDALDAAAQPAPAKRATLKLRSGNDG